MMFRHGRYGTGAVRSSKIPYLFNVFDGMLNNISNLMVQNSSALLMSPGWQMIGGTYRQGIYWLFSLSGTYFMLEISQSKLPDGASPVFLIVYANKTCLSSFGTAKGYPVVARIANLPTEIRNSDGVGGGRLVGWLPIVCAINIIALI